MNYKPALAAMSALFLFAISCADGDPTPTPSPEPTATPTATPSPVPTPTPTPTATPTPTPSPTPTATPSPTPTPRFSSAFEVTRCAFLSDPGSLGFRLPDAECGYLTVPENRSNPNSRDIRLHVTIFESYASAPKPDPVVFLSGGPGQGAMESIGIDPGLLGYSNILFERELIVIDQRGTGYSEPKLECPELDNPLFDPTADDATALAEQTAACRDRLTQLGIDLSAYNSAESAADLDLLRRTLGYEKWNLLGVSYGTRLAQTIARDFPEGVRSVILDSAYPIEVDLYSGRLGVIDRAISSLDSKCAGIAVGCEDSFKDLVISVAQSLDEDPPMIEVTDVSTGEKALTPLDGSTLFELVLTGMYSRQLIPHLPALVQDVSEGRYGLASALLSTLSGDGSIATGAHVAVQCAEETPFSDPSVAEASRATFPELASIFSGIQDPLTGFQTICDNWVESDPPAIENEPVSVQGIPALALAGELDPVTPPEWGELMSAGFEDGSYLLFEGIGHAVTVGSACAMDTVIEFLDDLAPLSEEDVPCMTSLAEVTFIDPLRSVSLEEFDETAWFVPFTSVRPEGWNNPQIRAVYQRSELGIHSILQQAAPLTPEEFLESYFEALDIDRPEPGALVESPYATWTTFQFELVGSTVDLATADFGDGVTGIVLVSSLSDTYQLLHDELFLPALMAFQLLEDA